MIVLVVAADVVDAVVDAAVVVALVVVVLLDCDVIAIGVEVVVVDCLFHIDVINSIFNLFFTWK